ncbi:MAG: hypothetical protein ACHP6I_03395 [Rickettsiales bacterium]
MILTKLPSKSSENVNLPFQSRMDGFAKLGLVNEAGEVKWDALNTLIQKNMPALQFDSKETSYPDSRGEYLFKYFMAITQKLENKTDYLDQEKKFLDDQTALFKGGSILNEEVRGAQEMFKDPAIYQYFKDNLLPARGFSVIYELDRELYNGKGTLHGAIIPEGDPLKDSVISAYATPIKITENGVESIGLAIHVGMHYELNRPTAIIDNPVVRALSNEVSSKPEVYEKFIGKGNVGILSDAGYHTGDEEVFSVLIKQDQLTKEFKDFGMLMGQHNHDEFIAADKFKLMDDGHKIIYVAQNTHATYDKPITSFMDSVAHNFDNTDGKGVILKAYEHPEEHLINATLEIRTQNEPTAGITGSAGPSKASPGLRFSLDPTNPLETLLHYKLTADKIEQEPYLYTKVGLTIAEEIAAQQNNSTVPTEVEIPSAHIQPQDDHILIPHIEVDS